MAGLVSNLCPFVYRVFSGSRASIAVQNQKERPGLKCDGQRAPSIVRAGEHSCCSSLFAFLRIITGDNSGVVLASTAFRSNLDGKGLTLLRAIDAGESIKRYLIFMITGIARIYPWKFSLAGSRGCKKRTPTASNYDDRQPKITCSRVHNDHFLVLLRCCCTLTTPVDRSAASLPFATLGTFRFLGLMMI